MWPNMVAVSSASVTSSGRLDTASRLSYLYQAGIITFWWRWNTGESDRDHQKGVTKGYNNNNVYNFTTNKYSTLRSFEIISHTINEVVFLKWLQKHSYMYLSIKHWFFDAKNVPEIKFIEKRIHYKRNKIICSSKCSRKCEIFLPALIPNGKCMYMYEYFPPMFPYNQNCPLGNDCPHLEPISELSWQIKCVLSEVQTCNLTQNLLGMSPQHVDQ